MFFSKKPTGSEKIKGVIKSITENISTLKEGIEESKVETDVLIGKQVNRDSELINKENEFTEENKKREEIQNSILKKMDEENNAAHAEDEEVIEAINKDVAVANAVKEKLEDLLK